MLERGTAIGADGTEHEIERIVVNDTGPGLAPLPEDPRIDERIGDFSERGAAEALTDADTGVVFHLAAVVSGEAEQSFDLGMRVNFHGSVQLLDALRARGACPRLVFTSSVAAYGGDMPEVIEDSTILAPQTSYGSQKAAVELLVHDYSRKGFIDGRALRLPTVVGATRQGERRRIVVRERDHPRAAGRARVCLPGRRGSRGVAAFAPARDRELPPRRKPSR